MTQGYKISTTLVLKDGNSANIEQIKLKIINSLAKMMLINSGSGDLPGERVLIVQLLIEKCKCRIINSNFGLTVYMEFENITFDVDGRSAKFKVKCRDTIENVIKENKLTLVLRVESNITLKNNHVTYRSEKIIAEDGVIVRYESKDDSIL